VKIREMRASAYILRLLLLHRLRGKVHGYDLETAIAYARALERHQVRW
jgi:hypothetical protein